MFALPVMAVPAFTLVNSPAAISSYGWLFLRGVALGWAIAAPVGPIGVLCIRRTLAFGRRIGLVSGMGAATADMLYGAVAAFGLTAVSSLLLGLSLWIRLVGAVFLAYLGVRMALAHPAPTALTTDTEASQLTGGAPGAYASTLGLTLTNPATILSFVAIFAGVGLVGAHADPLASGLTVVGVFCGSAVWWLILSSVVGALRKRFSLRALRWVNLLSGATLLIFAALALLSVVPTTNW
ncbi:MAG: LysE family transporter [Ktedonobacterales bacterium]